MGHHRQGIGGMWGTKGRATIQDYTFVRWVEGRYVHEPVFGLPNDAAAVQAAEARARSEIEDAEAHLHVLRSDGTCVATIRQRDLSPDASVGIVSDPVAVSVNA